MADQTRLRPIIAGASASDPKALTGKTVLQAQAEQALAAIEDAGLRLKDVDAVFAHMDDRFSSLMLTEYLGIKTRYSSSTNLGGMSSVSHVAQAVEAIKAGLCEVAVVAYASLQASERTRKIGGGGEDPRTPRGQFVVPYGQLIPIGFYAMLAQLHMHRYGTTRANLAEIAVMARRWAQLNPEATMRDPLTVEDVLAAPLIADPFSARDCCLVTDGAGAIVVTTAERARDLRKPAVSLLGYAQSQSHHFTPLGVEDWLDYGVRRDADIAFGQAGVSRSDIDVVEIYDHFTIGVLLALEELGFCERGEGGAFATADRLGPGGALPTNTSGGGLSYCHPGMFGMMLMVETVRQLRGECGERQVKDARLALCQAPGLMFSGDIVCVLGRE